MQVLTNQPNIYLLQIRPSMDVFEIHILLSFLLLLLLSVRGLALCKQLHADLLY